ncbi:PTS system oligo-beta-mannoside-specific EIIC component [Clostridioides difficile]|uniref:PTS sugar transporter subunit IIC n=1 Tax=Clostridioides difficile TaxID=1496 RepID=UPI00097FF036|nr:PTS transporter subunit EIIC [Clostridioides difficile]SJR47925.1 PTS system oligo-beta-mannoside-specific EIIC component [Clostridioides difficile]HBG5503646.1 PTS sugar transporter subunit IIC [Clostridioides difficile]
MEALQNNLRKFLLPIAQKIEKQRHLQAIKEGMISITPIIIVGSLSMLFMALNNMLPEGSAKTLLSENMDTLLIPNKFTMSLLSIYSAFFIAQALAKKYNLNHVEIGMTAVVAQLVVCGQVVDGVLDTSYLDAQGLFVSILVALLVVDITKFMNDKNLVIRFPKEVPSVVNKSFRNLTPMIVCIMLFTAIAAITKNVSGQPLPAIIMNFLAPAISSVDNVFAVTIILFITQLLWFFGLHGAAITSSIWMPIAATYMAENATLIAAGGDPKYVFTIGFYYGFLQVTGSGITLGLVYLMSRSNFNSMGKVVILPSLFGINEPVIFGTPIVMNPYMFVPFVFGPVLVGALNFMALKVGLVGLPIAEPPGFLPPGVAAFLMTLDWKAIVLVFASIILMTLIYYPFFKIMEKEELNKNAELATTLDDDSFDF